MPYGDFRERFWEDTSSIKVWSDSEALIEIANYTTI